MAFHSFIHSLLYFFPFHLGCKLFSLEMVESKKGRREVGGKAKGKMHGPKV